MKNLLLAISLFTLGAFLTNTQPEYTSETNNTEEVAKRRKLKMATSTLASLKLDLKENLVAKRRKLKMATSTLASLKSDQKENLVAKRRKLKMATSTLA